MKKLYIIGGVAIGLILALAFSAQAQTILFPRGGGTGTGTAPTYGQVLVGNSSGTYSLMATSSLGISGGGASLSGSTGQVTYFTGTNTAAGTSTISIATSGNVGIGTSTPQGKLEIMDGSNNRWLWNPTSRAMQMYFSSEVNPRFVQGLSQVVSGDSVILFNNNGTSGTLANAGAGIGQTANAARSLSFYTSNSTSLIERMRIDSSGFVGIGTTTPTRTLQVQGSMSAGLSGTGAGVAMYGSGTMGQVVGINNANTAFNAIQILTGASPIGITVDTSGRVGIGTSSPSYPLHVVSAGNPSVIESRSTNSAGSGNIQVANDTAVVGGIGTYGSAFGVTGLRNNTYVNATNDLYLGASSQVVSGGTANIHFMTGGYNPGSQIRMTVDSSGDVGIGTSVPSYPLHVTATSTGSYVTYLDGTNSGAGVVRGIGLHNNYSNAGVSYARSIEVQNPSATGSGAAQYIQVAYIDNPSGGSLSNTALAIAGAPTSGSYSIYNASANQSYFNGSVGIGTTTPSRKLHVEGNLIRASGPTVAGLEVYAGGANSDVDYDIYTDGSSLLFRDRQSGDNTRIAIDNTGKVGIGTVSPSTTLHVVGTTTVSQGVTVGSGSTINGTPSNGVLTVGLSALQSAGMLYVQNGGGEALTSGSRVGIASIVNNTPASASTATIRGAHIAPAWTGTAVSPSGILQGASIQISASPGLGGTLGRADGLFMLGFNNSVGTVTNLSGGRFSLSNQGGGLVTTGRGGFFEFTNNNNSTTTTAQLIYAATPTISSGSVTNLYGLFLQNMTGATNNYAIYSEGGQSYHAGNLGIGTAAPAEKLHVAGAVKVTGVTIANTASSGSMEFISGNTRFNSWGANTSTRGGFQFLQVASDGTLPLTPLAISTAGNIGIGTTTPRTLVVMSGLNATTTLNAVSSGYSSLAFTNSDNDATSGLDTSYLRWKYTDAELRMVAGRSDLGRISFNTITSGVERVRMYLTNAGNVGIGTTTPLSTLAIRADGTLGIPYDANPSVTRVGELAVNTTAASTSLRYFDGVAERALYDTIAKDFTIPSSTIAYYGGSGATTTIPMGFAFRPETWLQAVCASNSGTGGLRFGDGTNWMEYIPISTTGTFIDFSTNNTFVRGEARQFQVRQEGTVTRDITCSYLKREGAD